MSCLLITIPFAALLFVAARLRWPARAIVVILLLLAFTPVHNGLFSWLLNSHWELVKDSPVIRMWFISSTQDERPVLGFNHFLLGPSEGRYIETGEHFWEEGL
jgi:hypothetical protein